MSSETSKGLSKKENWSQLACQFAQDTKNLNNHMNVNLQNIEQGQRFFDYLWQWEYVLKMDLVLHIFMQQVMHFL